MEVDKIPTMPDISSRYETETIQIPVALGNVRILDSDPQRFYVKFIQIDSDPGFVIVYPGPSNEQITGDTESAGFDTYKFTDCPSIVCGEWYVRASGSGEMLAYICRYIGR